MSVGLLFLPALIQNYIKNHNKKALRMRRDEKLLLKTATLVFYIQLKIVSVNSIKQKPISKAYVEALSLP